MKIYCKQPRLLNAIQVQCTQYLHSVSFCIHLSIVYPSVHCTTFFELRTQDLANYISSLRGAIKGAKIVPQSSRTAASSSQDPQTKRCHNVNWKMMMQYQYGIVNLTVQLNHANLFPVRIVAKNINPIQYNIIWVESWWSIGYSKSWQLQKSMVKMNL